MNILVTGSQGFVGHHLYNILERLGHNVFGVDIRDNGFKQNFKQVDLRIEVNAKEATKDMDIVFHLASDVGGSNYIYGSNQFKILRNNSQIDVNIVDSCIFNSVKKIVYFSSSCVYDDCSSYGFGKVFGEQLIKHSGLDYLIVRPQNFYGIEDYKSGVREQVVMAFFRKAMSEDKDFEIIGNGNVLRSFIEVEEGINTILDNLTKKNKTMDLGGEWISMTNLAKKIIKIVGNKKNIYYTGDKAVVRKKMIKFKSKTKLDKGLSIIYQWMK